MNTTVVIVGAITRTVVELAFIGAGLKLALTVAPRFQIAAPKAPVQPQDKDKAKADTPKADAAEDARTGPVPLEVAS